MCILYELPPTRQLITIRLNSKNVDVFLGFQKNSIVPDYISLNWSQRKIVMLVMHTNMQQKKHTSQEDLRYPFKDLVSNVSGYVQKSKKGRKTGIKLPLLRIDAEDAY